MPVSHPRQNHELLLRPQFLKHGLAPLQWRTPILLARQNQHRTPDVRIRGDLRITNDLAVRRIAARILGENQLADERARQRTRCGAHRSTRNRVGEFIEAGGRADQRSAGVEHRRRRRRRAHRAEPHGADDALGVGRRQRRGHEAAQRVADYDGGGHGQRVEHGERVGGQRGDRLRGAGGWRAARAGGVVGDAPDVGG